MKKTLIFSLATVATLYAQTFNVSNVAEFRENYRSNIDKRAVAYNSSAIEVPKFIERFYEVILDRDPDPSGLEYWKKGLLSNELTGSDIAREFILSNEFKSKNYDNNEYLEKLYKTFFNREPDEAGMKFWLSKLEKKELNRDQVLNEFVHSKEFEQICNEYGIKPFDDLREFVSRFYIVILDRMPDLGGVNYWSKLLRDKSKTGSDIARDFILSKEFKSKNLNNEEYITKLYKAFFDRDPDEIGFSHWLELMDRGASREEILDGFLKSKEFNTLCEKFGIKAFNNGYKGIVFKEDFSGDLNFWRINNNDDRPGIIKVEDGVLKILRTNVGGNGGSVGISKELNIDLVDSTTIYFDAKIINRDVGDGCGWTCEEYPVNVKLTLLDSDNNELVIKYSLNYGNAIEDKNDINFKQKAISIPQNQWVRNITYKVKDYWSNAVKIKSIDVYGSGWSYESQVDNIIIKN